MPRDGLLKDKKAIITAAGSGMDARRRCSSRRRAPRSIVADLNEERATGVVDEITAAGGEATAHVVDVSDMGQMNALFAFAAERWDGKLDVLYSHAGIPGPAGLDVSDADWDQSIDINLRSGFKAAGLAQPLLAAAGGGSIRAARCWPAISSRCARTAAAGGPRRSAGRRPAWPAGASPAAGPGTIGHRDRAVERHHRLAADPLSSSYRARICGQSVASALGASSCMRRDGRLELVRAHGAARQRAGEQRDALGDRRLVPPAAVLLGQRDQFAVRPWCAPRAGRRSAASARAARPPRGHRAAARCTIRASRIASADSSVRCSLARRWPRIPR